MPNVVRNLGDAKHTRNLQGQDVYRQDSIYLPTYHQHIPCLNTDTHFIFKSVNMGASTLCTCGSPAIIVGYHAYYRLSSFIGNEVLACHNFIQYGRHSDGSH